MEQRLQTESASPRISANLSEMERRILELLARGHTVKSIASETGWTVVSINERLRNARRKTGAASSRELARLFVESSDPEKIDLAPPAALPSDIATSSSSEKASRYAKGLAMLALFLLTITGVGGVLVQGNAVESAESTMSLHDPLIDDMLATLDRRPELPNSPEHAGQLLEREGAVALVRKLHGIARAKGGEDARHAARAFGAILTDLAHRGGATGQARVTCSASVCELAMKTSAPLPSAGIVPGDARADDAELRRALAGAGFSEVITLRGRVGGGNSGYAGYWMKKAAS
ncbi:helix-turn-helix domain-containing protein [Sphingomonas kyeonggiensis]|uniref:DNA-binding CsgD family transcriptional regulator n=1 Tax=Sphingomonas kyeonggiensis TaxID=1268553 RepID=A0A7W6JUV1_9SPHN|nr:helix-turn-helix transcriptional regulator [Sphingomonas kyeonggiensis]MBB4098926.1 DNA-binding CsgD family transcriptional regulator [Sphingomonas kyeonggiensis]